MEQTTLEPLLWPSISTLTRYRYVLTICAIKILLEVGWLFRKLLIRLGFVPRLSGDPIFSKVYSCRPRLKHRFFYPKSYQPGKLLPLYIDVHGGGFAFGAPEHDDEFCSFLSNHFNFLVVSIDYSLTPWARFPVPTLDVAAVALAILDDPILPIDLSRVAIGGFSAGGNLALSACQLPALQGKIKAAVPWYAPVDWSVDYAHKLASRPYKHPGDVDKLATVAPMFNNIYLPTSTNQRDPLLSMLYAKKETLPGWIYTITAEYDMLGDEAKRMMIRLAEIETLMETETDAFQRQGGRLRWKMIKGVEHSFTHWWLKTGKAANSARPVAEAAFLDVGNWLAEYAFV